LLRAGQNEPVSNSERHPARMQALNAAPASLDDFRGKAVCIKFWATWCPLCLAGLEDFAALSAEYAGSEDIAVISVVAPGLNGEVGRMISLPGPRRRACLSRFISMRTAL